jgi:hypothetical protein
MRRDRDGDGDCGFVGVGVVGVEDRDEEDDGEDSGIWITVRNCGSEVLKWDSCSLQE